MTAELLAPSAITPEPGIYENVAPEVYHAWEAASNSRLAQLLKTPAHLRAYMAEPYESTDAQVIGTAAHTLILEPEKWDERYVVSGACEATVKSSGQPCGNAGKVYHDGRWYCGVKGHAPEGAGDPGRAVLAAPVAAICRGMANAVLAHPRLRKLLEAEGRSELSVVWRDEDTGILCKARIDRLVESYGVVLDLKTARDASPRGFEKSVAEYGYHRQLPLYGDALAAHGIDMKHLVFAAVEKERPYACAGYRLTGGAADEGRIEARALLRRYARCMDSGEFPGYPTDIMDVALPAWAYGRVTEGVVA